MKKRSVKKKRKLNPNARPAARRALERAVEIVQVRERLSAALRDYIARTGSTR